MRAIGNRAVAGATAFALALAATSIPAFAASSSAKSEQVNQATTIDLSAAKKRHRHYRGIDPAGRAMLGAVGSVFGLIAATAAADRARDAYYARYPYPYYGYGAYPYQPGPYYYAYPY